MRICGDARGPACHMIANDKVFLLPLHVVTLPLRL